MWIRRVIRHELAANPTERLGSLRALLGVASLLIAAIWSSACRSSSAAPMSGVVWQERLEVAAGEAHRGPWRMNDSDYRWVDDPAVALANDGEAAVVWANQAQKDLFFQRYGPKGERRLRDPTKLSNNPQTFSWLPRLVVAPDDPQRLFVLWQEIVFSGGSHGGEILFARSSDGGASFSAPANLSNSLAGDGKGRLSQAIWDNGSLDLARGASGELYAAWTEYEGALWFRRSTDDGKSFSAPLRLNAKQGAPARAPSLAVAPTGAVHVAWTVGENPAADVHHAHSSDRGQSFGDPSAVCESAGHSDAPKLAVDGAGTVHLVYAESSRAPGSRARIQYSRKRAGMKTFDAPRALPLPEHARSASARYPHVGIDRERRIYVLWEHYPDGDARPRGLGFTASRDAGEHFAPPVLILAVSSAALGINGSQQGLLTDKLAVNAAGAVAIVNSTFRADEKSQVWLLRGGLAKRPR